MPEFLLDAKRYMRVLKNPMDCDEKLMDMPKTYLKHYYISKPHDDMECEKLQLALLRTGVLQVIDLWQTSVDTQKPFNPGK